MDCGDLLFAALDQLEREQGDLDSASYWEDESGPGPEALAIATTDPDIARELWKFLGRYIDTRPSSNG